MGLFRTFFYIDIRVIYHVYPVDIPDISHVYQYKKRYGTNPEMFYMVYTIHMDEDTIWMEYTMYIPCIYHVYTMHMLWI